MASHEAVRRFLLGGVQPCPLDIFAARPSLAALLLPSDLEDRRPALRVELRVAGRGERLVQVLGGFLGYVFSCFLAGLVFFLAGLVVASAPLRVFDPLTFGLFLASFGGSFAVQVVFVPLCFIRRNVSLP